MLVQPGDKFDPIHYVVNQVEARLLGDDFAQKYGAETANAVAVWQAAAQSALPQRALETFEQLSPDLLQTLAEHAKNHLQSEEARRAIDEALDYAIKELALLKARSGETPGAS